MKVIIAEKPSVAQGIAAIVGTTSRKDGYMEGSGYAVTWAFGHLVGLAMPEAYGFTGFQKENLPILPKEFILVPRQVKEGKEYRNAPGVMKQLGIIKELFSKADGIVVATDAGREGELIFRYIYDYAGCTLPFERLWISSLTDRAIKDGLQNLKPGSDYDNLYLSAKARSQADYVVGVNASQALSIAAGHGFSADKVRIEGFENIEARYNGYFDVVASNIPFGDVAVFDPAFSNSKDPARRQASRSIHNYFFMKGIDCVREGGLVAFITSQGVMNSESNRPVREWLM